MNPRLAIMYAVGLMGLREDDIFLSSFPRSGSTWVRFILCNIISLQEWEGKSVDFNLLNDTMVELGVSNLMKSTSYQSLPRIVKTHRSYHSLFGRRAAIGIIRDPRDVMLSYYHYQKDRQGSYSGSFSDFIRHQKYGLQTWMQHYKSWRHYWQVVVRYEDLRLNTFHEICRLLDFFNAVVSEETVQEAIERSSMKRVRLVEAHSTSSTNSQARFARKGSVGQWVEEWSERDLKYYAQVCQNYGFNLYLSTNESLLN